MNEFFEMKIMIRVGFDSKCSILIRLGNFSKHINMWKRPSFKYMLHTLNEGERDTDREIDRARERCVRRERVEGDSSFESRIN